jgi:transposase-like protein
MLRGPELSTELVVGGGSDDVMQTYSEKFKRKMVQRMSGIHPMSATALSKEVGVPQATLSRWLLAAGTLGAMTPTKKDDLMGSDGTKRAEDRTPEQKLRVIVAAAQLPPSELGAFLRREGLHEADLEAWRETVLGAFKPAPSKHAKSVEARRVRELERELRRKDKALAEAAALLVLQKKVQALWGDADDDTKRESDE